MLVNGFLDLTSRSAATPASPTVPTPPPAAEELAATTPSPAAPVVFDAESKGVVSPRGRSCLAE
jgi:hypothetical protein